MSNRTMMIIQHIETIWTKKSRGMPEAGKRNAVSRKLEIPVNAKRFDGILIHKVTAREWEDFSLEQKTEIIKNDKRYWTLAFHRESDAVQVLFTYDYIRHGRPERKDHRTPLFKLALGEWSSFHINGRFTSYSGQYYTQHFLNVGNIAEFNPDLFVEIEPKVHVNKMDHLF